MFDNKYPYTDYHELNLDWFMGEFKKLVAEWEETKGEWNTLHDYVQNYFENLNVQTEIDNKINAMILDGTFADIVSPFVTAALPALVAGQLPDVVAAQISAVVAAQISAVVADQLPAVAAAAAAQEVGDWLAAHIDPNTGYVIDDTLTVSQAAADAKITGNRINSLCYDTVFVSDELERGYWAANTGKLNQTTTYWVCSKSFITDDIITIRTPDSNISLLLSAWDEHYNYIGMWFGSSFETTFDSSYTSTNIDMTFFKLKYPGYHFKFNAVKLGVGANMSVDQFISASHVTYVYRYPVRFNDICNITDIALGNVSKSLYWANATIPSDGSLNILETDSSLYGKRAAQTVYMQFTVPVTIKPKNGYEMSITRYYSNKSLLDQFSSWSTAQYTFNRPDLLYRMTLKKTDNSDFNYNTIENSLDVIVRQSTPSDRALAEYSNIKTVNHRGYNTIAPENTIPAYELSAKLGYKYVETDVLFTSDGVPVLMHDDTINRTCCMADGSEIVGDVSIDNITYDDLIDLYDACTTSQYVKWAGVKVPTFAQFMLCCKKKNLHAWIELKWTHTYTQNEVQQIISIIKQYGMEEHVTFISFSHSALNLVKTEWDDVELGLNGTISDAESLRTGKNRVFMIYNKNTDYSAAVAAGFQVCVYTIDSISQLAALNNPAYDSILTDNLEVSTVYDTINS